MNKWVCLLLGGAAGTISRYLLAGWIYHLAGNEFPYGTFVVNLAGCFLIGFLTMILEVKMMLGPSARLLLMVGFCGAFTTFSTLILETNNLMREGQNLRAFTYAAASFVLGFAFFRSGIWLGERF